MSLRRRLRSIFACPERPNARAISRFPAGWSDEAMKSRICLRLGRPAERFFSISHRHCEEHSDEAIQLRRGSPGLLRFARNDGYFFAAVGGATYGLNAPPGTAEA